MSWKPLLQWQSSQAVETAWSSLKNLRLGS